MKHSSVAISVFWLVIPINSHPYLRKPLHLSDSRLFNLTIEPKSTLAHISILLEFSVSVRELTQNLKLETYCHHLSSLMSDRCDALIK